MTPADRASARAVDRKATLFCPACEHEAPLDGDWALEAGDGAAGERTDVTCPECGHVVVSQPEFPGRSGGGLPAVPSLSGGPTPGTVVRPVLRLLDSVVRHDVL